MVRIPSFTRATTDGRGRHERVETPDGPDNQPTTRISRAVVPEQIDDRGKYRTTSTVRVPVEDEPTQPQPTERSTTDPADATRALPPARKARASAFATLGLMAGVTAMLLVLTGLLAGYGIAVALVGLLLSLGGVSATARRHVAGRSDALLGVAFSVGALVLGGLALTGALSWLTSDTDTVRQLREWLDTQFSFRL